MMRSGLGAWYVEKVQRPACEEVGIDAQTMRAYHKSHINKTMGTTITGFAFEDNIENGGEAMKARR
jgi:hypothetical protein